MKFFTYYIYKKRWLILLAWGYVAVLVLPTPYTDFFSYHESFEMYMSFWEGILSACILTSEDETEFARCYGASFPRLAFGQWLPHFLYPLLTAFLSCPLYFAFHDLRPQGGRDFSSLGVRYMTLLFSVFVTFLFLSALMLFLRVVVRNVYVSFAAFFVVYFVFYEFRRLLLQGAYPRQLVACDIWLTGFLFERAFPVTKDMWLGNRFGYLILSISLLLISYLLLKHQQNRTISS